jgi:transcriptional regulator with XRE-family HTH domain
MVEQRRTRLTVGMPDKPMTDAERRLNMQMLTHVKEWLQYRKRSQRQLAEALEVSEPTVSKWLRGGVGMSVAQFTKIAAFLDAQPEDLLEAPPGEGRAARYRKIAEVAQEIPEDALEEWLALGRRLSGTRRSE